MFFLLLDYGLSWISFDIEQIYVCIYIVNTTNVKIFPFLMRMLQNICVIRLTPAGTASSTLIEENLPYMRKSLCQLITLYFCRSQPPRSIFDSVCQNY